MNLQDRFEYHVTHSPGADIVAISFLVAAMGASVYGGGFLAAAVPGVAVFGAYVWGKVNGEYYSGEVDE